MANADAELLALQPEIDAADRLNDAAHDALTVAEDSYLAVRPPAPPKPDGTAFTKEEWFLAFAGNMAELNERPSPEWAAHDAALKAWQAEDERLHEEHGVATARGQIDEAIEHVDAVRDRLVAFRATTLAGLAFKAQNAAGHFPGDPDPQVAEPIIDDLLAMTGEAAS